METAFRLSVNGVFYGIVWLTQNDMQDLVKIKSNVFALKTNPNAIYKVA